MLASWRAVGGRGLWRGGSRGRGRGVARSCGLLGMLVSLGGWRAREGDLRDSEAISASRNRPVEVRLC